MTIHTNLVTGVESKLLITHVRSVCDKYGLETTLYNQAHVNRQFIFLMNIAHRQMSCIDSIFAIVENNCNKLLYDAFITSTVNTIETIKTEYIKSVHQYRRHLYDDCISMPSYLSRLLIANLKIAQILRLHIRNVNMPRNLVKESLRICIRLCLEQPNMQAHMYAYMTRDVQIELDRQIYLNKLYINLCKRANMRDLIEILLTDSHTIICDTIKRRIISSFSLV
jgi:hypothetical protein